MASSLPKDIPIDRETMMKEVTRGYELTTQLQSLLQQTQPALQGDRGSELQVLIEDLMQSQTKSLSILNSVAADKDGGSSELGSGSTIDQGIERSGDKVMLSAARDGNQSHRGRKNDHLQPRTRITSAPHYDGHQWRKSGEKKILNSSYRRCRCYYRCTHKDGRGCPAKKQVQQRDSKDPPMFIVTYIKDHTCRNTTTTTTTIPQRLSVDPTSPTTDLHSFSITFGSNTKSAPIGQMDNWQPATWPSSSHPVPPDQPTHESMGVDQELLPFMANEVGGGGDVALLSDTPTHQSLMDSSELKLKKLDSFMAEEVGGGGELDDLEPFMDEEAITNYCKELGSLL